MNDHSTESAVDEQDREPLSLQDESESGAHWLVKLRRLDKPWIILLLLFFVTAALGLPMVWFSNAFSMPAKFVLTIVVVIYTIALLAGFVAVMIWCYQRIAGAL